MPRAPKPPPRPQPLPQASTAPHQSRGGYAPWHTIPPQKIISIEHPAIIKNVDKAIETLGGAKALKKLSETNASSGLDLRFRPEDIMQPPIQSKTVATNNILLKIRIPKRKRTSGEGPDERSVLEKLRDARGEYTVEAVGVIARTVRFRDMANYQFNTADMDIVQRVRVELGGLEYEKIKNFDIPPSRGLSDPHPILPPPAFSNTAMQHNYHYRQNPAIKKTLVAGKPALLNLQAAPKTLTPMVHISAPAVPLHPPDSLRPYDLLDRANKQCVDHLRKLFAQRPIWTRRALFNHFPKNLQSLVRFSMVHVAYMWRAGPWRDTCVVYGLDPRADSQYRTYQAVFFQVDTEKTAKGREKVRTGASHIFDGKNLVRDGRCFQLCDVTDPLLKGVIDGARVRSKCDVLSPLYPTRHFAYRLIFVK
ncbi:RNA polymerase III transcription factor IIIC subunit-domain-containing protein [Tuber borchii]|uniref:RNA polymerase III transcription factor IIIC subunit-domain-containing protein n=1 Tax=Tuber borchii TaxID=42251 RepID=A0A2T6ZHT5_TUBBO|nr:RNA polymerase III transcription factor IIIC subunit-domain-containing protein [Tuber borchii]